MKLTVIGAGSTYTPELVEGLILNTSRLPLAQLTFMDTSAERLEILGNLTRRMLKARGSQINLSLTRDLSGALPDSDFVIAQIRVGGSAARVQDEQAAFAAGLLAQETTGAAGFLKAARTIPVMLELAAAMEQYCPRAWLINFTNPVSLVTQAISRHSRIKVLGLCNVPVTLRKLFAGIMHLPDEHLELAYAGLNHLSWVNDVTYQGTSLKAELIRRWRSRPKMPFSKACIAKLGVFPSPYLRYYYFTAQVLEQQRCKGLRAPEVQKLEARLLQLYRNPRLRHKPALLAKRGGSFYSSAAVQLMVDLAQGQNCSPALPIINLPVAYAGFPEGTVMEAPVRIAGGKLSPQPARLGAAELELTRSIKAYEELAIEAIVTSSYLKALQALQRHPLVGGGAVTAALLKSCCPYFS